MSGPSTVPDKHCRAEPDFSNPLTTAGSSTTSLPAGRDHPPSSHPASARPFGHLKSNVSSTNGGNSFSSNDQDNENASTTTATDASRDKGKNRETYEFNDEVDSSLCLTSDTAQVQLFTEPPKSATPITRSLPLAAPRKQTTDSPSIDAPIPRQPLVDLHATADGSYSSGGPAACSLTSLTAPTVLKPVLHVPLSVAKTSASSSSANSNPLPNVQARVDRFVKSSNSEQEQVPNPLDTRFIDALENALSEIKAYEREQAGRENMQNTQLGLAYPENTPDHHPSAPSSNVLGHGKATEDTPPPSTCNAPQPKPATRKECKRRRSFDLTDANGARLQGQQATQQQRQKRQRQIVPLSGLQQDQDQQLRLPTPASVCPTTQHQPAMTRYQSRAATKPAATNWAQSSTQEHLRYDAPASHSNGSSMSQHAESVHLCAPVAHQPTSGPSLQAVASCGDHRAHPGLPKASLSSETPPAGLYQWDSQRQIYVPVNPPVLQQQVPRQPSVPDQRLYATSYASGTQNAAPGSSDYSGSYAAPGSSTRGGYYAVGGYAAGNSSTAPSSATAASAQHSAVHQRPSMQHANVTTAIPSAHSYGGALRNSTAPQPPATAYDGGTRPDGQSQGAPAQGYYNAAPQHPSAVVGSLYVPPAAGPSTQCHAGGQYHVFHAPSHSLPVAGPSTASTAAVIALAPAPVAAQNSNRKRCIWKHAYLNGSACPYLFDLSPGQDVQRQIKDHFAFERAMWVTGTQTYPCLFGDCLGHKKVKDVTLRKYILQHITGLALPNAPDAY
ncbi:hypothetical protein BD626DRAFT_571498 [Schizophyllum amplum]|uniref:Uncharacterized protein n=1 Tax=Schizophyllum amplum TaxID=97359 RepID=A0A550C7L6_9AGAR|nr:hypothetical protein BD626DRAFT_571498 [Auriculariopsis ampla]